MRREQLLKQPLCEECTKATPPRVTLADIVHHVLAHHGDYDLFWYGELASVCKRCHDTVLQQREKEEVAKRRKA